MMAAAAIAQPPPTVVDNFDGGVLVGNHPYDTGHPQNGYWYDAASNAFATPAASTLDGSPSLRHNDGGFVNGIYRIYNNVITRTSEYDISVKWDIVEDPAQLNSIRAYQMGIIPNGSHRSNATDPNFVAGASIVVNYGGTLDSTDNNANPSRTDSFPVLSSDPGTNFTAGDSLLISFGTDVTSGNWNANSGGWGTGHVLMDDIVLTDKVVPVNMSGFSID